MNQRLPQWELTLIVLTLAAAAWSATLSPYYLSVGQILYSTRQFVYPGILSIGLAVVVILSEIDISLASTLAFGGVLFSKFSAFGVPIWLAVPSVVAACAALGALNGVLVARMNLPSLAVTLGTMGAFRGPGFHHRIGDGLHELRRFLSLCRIGEAVRRPAGLLSPVPCARDSCWRADALDGLRPSLLRRRPQQGSRLGGRHRRRPDQDRSLRSCGGTSGARRPGLDRSVRLGSRRQRRRRDPVRGHRRGARRRRHQRRPGRNSRRGPRACFCLEPCATAWASQTSAGRRRRSSSALC